MHEATVIAFLFVLASRGSGADSPGPGGPPILQPASYVSPSGSWTLRVDPTDPKGEGPCRYELTRLGARVADSELPFTLSNAAIDDRGYSAGVGCARSEGVEPRRE